MDKESRDIAKEARIETLQHLLNELPRKKFKYATDVLAYIAEQLHEEQTPKVTYSTSTSPQKITFSSTN